MAASIQGSGFPLVFRTSNDIADPPAADGHGGALPVRVYVRALEGMQKEALVLLRHDGQVHAWRMVSDEGPYLNGTDLAPFPLAYFSAGMQFSLLSELNRHARMADVVLKSVDLVQDNFYTMNGSALQGTMIGGAKPVALELRIESDNPPEDIAALVRSAEAASPAHALMREVLHNTFSLTYNDRAIPVEGLTPSPSTFADDLERVFAAVSPDSDADNREEIITKLSAAETVFGVEGGAASSLQAEQKRTLHVHGEATMAVNQLPESTIRLFRPIGSTFRFLCDETAAAGGTEAAPPPLAYLAAGVGFCYMTQLGRYAHITQQKLHTYQIIQDCTFGDSPYSFDTHVYLEAGEPTAVAQKSVRMGEQTCFLHAAMRTSNPSEISVVLNGKSIELPD